jgi:hypothetical protein
MKGTWLSVVDAVRAIGEACGVSVGAACVMLSRSCGSEVRSRKRPWPEPDEPPKPSLDLEHGWLVLAGGVVMRADIEINGDDLRGWITRQETKKTEFGERPKRMASGGRRGPKPLTLESTIKKMRDDIAAGQQTELKLRDMKQVALAETYGVNRGTACKARDEVLRESVANLIVDK